MFPREHEANSSLVFFVIFICLSAILFILWYVYGPSMFVAHNDRSRVFDAKVTLGKEEE